MRSFLTAGGMTTRMFENVLIPTDPTEVDPIVVEYAVEVAHRVGADVKVVSVTDTDQRRDHLRTEREEEAREAVDTIVQQAEDAGLDATGEVRTGMPAEEILASIRESGVDLVVMGTQGRTGAERLLLGSVAESVIRESPVPVLTVTPDAEPTVHS